MKIIHRSLFEIALSLKESVKLVLEGGYLFSESSGIPISEPAIVLVPGNCWAHRERVAPYTCVSSSPCPTEEEAVADFKVTLRRLSAECDHTTWVTPHAAALEAVTPSVYQHYGEGPLRRYVAYLSVAAVQGLWEWRRGTLRPEKK